MLGLWFQGKFLLQRLSFFAQCRSMKKHLLSGVSVIALAIATPAIAAPPAPVIYNWTGFYAGGNVGYSWGNANNSYNEPAFGTVTGLPTSFSSTERLNGVIGGVQAGYNWQANVNTVLGFETDIQGTGERGSTSSSNAYTFPSVTVKAHA